MNDTDGNAAILIVDESSADISPLVETLSRAGFRVTVANSREHAFEQTQQSPPRFIVLNGSMPGLEKILSGPKVIPLPTGDILTLEALERAHIITVLKRTNGVIEGPKGAAILLNLKPSTARFRMKKLGIARTDYIPQA
jgi:transcriptional regulator with GAF, ATPase, and Fis domain